MDTNQISAWWNTAVEWDARLAGAPSGLLLFLLCIAVGYVWRAIHICPNRFTPLAVMLTGALLHPLLSGGPVARTAVVGFIIGFLAWLFHRLLLRRIEDKFGLKIAEEDTIMITKPKGEE